MKDTTRDIETTNPAQDKIEFTLAKEPEINLHEMEKIACEKIGCGE